MVDALNKRVNFLNETIEENKIENTIAIHGRAEELAHDEKYREKFDIAVSRAVAPLNVLVEYLLPFVKVSGKAICMKGPKLDEEIEEAKNAIKILGGKIDTIEEINLGENENRKILIIKKIKNTESKYPRKAGTPSKKPIK